MFSFDFDEELHEEIKDEDITKLLLYSPMTVKEFIDNGFTRIIGKINHHIVNLEITGQAVLYDEKGRREVYDIEYIGFRSKKIYVEIELADWDEAEEFVDHYKNTRTVRLLTDYEKPTVRIYLKDDDILRFHRYT